MKRPSPSKIRLLNAAASVGYFMQALLQGCFIFAKAKQAPHVALENLEHLRRYLLQLFNSHTHSKRTELVT